MAQLCVRPADAHPIPPSAFNRRIGERVPHRLDEIEWRPPTPRRLFRGAPKPLTAQLVDLSVTGARVLAPEVPALSRGTRVQICVRGHHGVVEVRRIEPSTVDGLTTYGVEFVVLDDGLTELVGQVLSRRKPDADWRWTTER